MKQKFSIFYVIPKGLLLMFSLIVFGTLKSMEIPLVPVIKTIENVKPINEFKASDAAVISLALSPFKDFIVVGTGNSSGYKKFWGVSLWKKDEWNNTEIEEGIFAKHKIDLPINEDYVTQSLAISEDNKIIIGRSDDDIWKWDIENKKLIGFDTSNFLPLDKKPKIEHTRIIPSKNEIVVNQDISSLGLKGYKYTSARIYDLNSGKLLRSLEGAHRHLQDLAVNPAGTVVGGILDYGSAVIWNAETAEIIKELNVAKGLLGKKAEKPMLITTMDISKEYIVTYGLDDEVKLMNLAYEEVKSWKMTSMQHAVKDPSKYQPSVKISQLEITPNEQYIIFKTDVEGWIGIIDIETEKIVRFKISDYQSSADWPSCFIISNDSKHIIIGNDNGMVKIFDIEAIMGKKPIEKPVQDINMLRNSLVQLTSSLNSLASK